MGWSSANYIFDPVAAEIVKSDATHDQQVNILTVFIDQLQMGDWDTEEESLWEFKDHPAVVEAFRKCGIVE